MEELNIPVSKIVAIKNGDDFIAEDGTLYENSKITLPSKKVWSYAFCSDTKYSERIVPIIKNVDVLYHEATFLEAEMERAKHTMHSTAKQAGKIAKLAEVDTLLLGHYSARYTNLNNHLIEAKQEFEKVDLAIENKKFSFGE